MPSRIILMPVVLSSTDDPLIIIVGGVSRASGASGAHAVSGGEARARQQWRRFGCSRAPHHAEVLHNLGLHVHPVLHVFAALDGEPSGPPQRKVDRQPLPGGHSELLADGYVEILSRLVLPTRSAIHSDDQIASGNGPRVLAVVHVHQARHAALVVCAGADPIDDGCRRAGVGAIGGSDLPAHQVQGARGLREADLNGPLLLLADFPYWVRLVEGVLDPPRPLDSDERRPVGPVVYGGGPVVLPEDRHPPRGVVVEDDVVELQDLVSFQDQLVWVLVVPLRHWAEFFDLFDDDRLPVLGPFLSMLEAKGPAHDLVQGAVKLIGHEQLGDEFSRVLFVVSVFPLHSKAVVMPNPRPLDVEPEDFIRPL
mmetsp:Transcript_30110/g.86043  ORF Transcript_30110/g.86043 Transcript_30110/m.86043 type:complete len:367 (+) Transcript_30110:284-1384(+)